MSVFDPSYYIEHPSPRTETLRNLAGNIPYYPQLDERDCGATCLRMITEYYGQSLSMERLREATGTTERGADMSGLEAGAQALGFDTLAADLPYDELLKGDLLPVLLHWDRDHFIVVTKATFAKVWIHDPALGKRTMSRDDFEAHRYGPGRSRAGLIIRPSEKIKHPNEDKQETVDVASEGYNSMPVPWQFFVLSLFFAGAISFVLWTLHDVLQQAVDLQFREGVWKHLGSLFLAAAGLVLAAYLLRKEAIAYASARGRAEVHLLTEHLKIKAADLSRSIDGELYLKLINDIDDLRVWNAYNMASLVIGLVTMLTATIFLIATDWIWGTLLLIALVLLLLLGIYVFRSARDSREAAREAQLKQREALYEFARVLPDVQGLNGGDYLYERLQQKNESAELAFQSISSEFSAERQMIRAFILVASISLVGFGLYQLGYAGLQVGELLFGMLLLGITLVPFISICITAAKWQRLQPAKLRISELSQPGVASNNSLSVRPETLTLVWESISGAEQKISFPASCRIALAGSDEQTRADIISGFFGRPNRRNARLYFDEKVDVQRTLVSFGKLSHIDKNSVVASGSIASNIAMMDRPSNDAVAVAADLAGIPRAAPPRGLHSPVGFDGEGVSKELATRTLIARAIYADVDALVLNGATNELAAYDEGLLMDNLLAWCKGKLLVINSKRINAAYGCDLIVNVEASEIDSVGSHERLLFERGTYYYQVVASQSKLS